MNIAGAFDVHHRQLTFGYYLDTVTGQEEPGAGAPPDREHLRAWLARFAGQADAAFALRAAPAGFMSPRAGLPRT